MKKLRVEKLWIGAVGLGAIALLSNLSNNAAIAINTPSSPTPADDIRTGQLERSPLDGKLAQRNRNCRRIVAERSIPFSDGAGSGNALGDLTTGDKVELSNGTNTILGSDGRSYIGVRIPYIESSYNRPRQQSGYIPTRYQTYGGEMRSTLGTCAHRALW